LRISSLLGILGALYAQFTLELVGEMEEIRHFVGMRFSDGRRVQALSKLVT
jgi:hypothetical protein